MLSGKTYADITDAWQNLAFHIMPDNNLQAVTFLQREGCQWEAVLIVDNTLPQHIATLVHQRAVQRVNTYLMGGQQFLLEDELQHRERVVAVDAQANFFGIVGSLRKGTNLETKGIVALPSCNRSMLIMNINRLSITGGYESKQ